MTKHFQLLRFTFLIVLTLAFASAPVAQANRKVTVETVQFKSGLVGAILPYSVRVRKAKEKRQGSGNGSAYSKEKRRRLDAQTEFCKWTQEKKATVEPLDPDKQIYPLKPEEIELVARIAEIIEDKLEKSRQRAKQAAKVRKLIPIAAKSLGGRKGSEGKGKNGKGRAGRKEVDSPSPTTLAKRRQREREKLQADESLSN